MQAVDPMQAVEMAQAVLMGRPRREPLSERTEIRGGGVIWTVRAAFVGALRLTPGERC